MRRHDLVTLTTRASPLSVACCTSARAALHVQTWIAARRPFVCARQSSPQAADSGVRLGLAFVDAGIKHRATVRVAAADIARIEPPYPLGQCLGRFNAADAAVLARLDQALTRCASTARVFGSVSWELACGDAYRTASSDLDLLCAVASPDALDQVIQALDDAQAQLAFRLDGELRLPNGDCVSWREAAALRRNGRDAEILVKGERGVYLTPFNQCFRVANV